jgi:hypothetical protein
MSLDTDRLPRFRNPPVDEVAVGVQFTLQGFLPTHYGRFHERIKGDYPGVQFLPPQPPQVEVVPGSPAFSPPFLGFPPCRGCCLSQAMMHLLSNCSATDCISTGGRAG